MVAACGTDTAQPDLRWGTGEYGHDAARSAVAMFLSLVHVLCQRRLVQRRSVTARAAPRPHLNGQGVDVRAPTPSHTSAIARARARAAGESRVDVIPTGG